MSYQKRFDGVPRDKLEAVAKTAVEALAEASMILDKAGKRCLEILHTKPRGITLPGWHCKNCGGFNGSEKEELKECRACGKPNA